MSHFPSIGIILALLVVSGGFVAAVPINVTAEIGTSASDTDMDAASNVKVENHRDDMKTSTFKTALTSRPIAVSPDAPRSGTFSDDRALWFIADSGVNTAEVNDSEIFRKVETNGSSFVVHVDLSLFTSLFAQGEELRLVTGGTVEGERVVWFDIGITRTIDGFRTRADLSMNLPF